MRDVVWAMHHLCLVFVQGRWWWIASPPLEFACKGDGGGVGNTLPLSRVCARDGSAGAGAGCELWLRWWQQAIWMVVSMVVNSIFIAVCEIIDISKTSSLKKRLVVRIKQQAIANEIQHGFECR
jgi:hypothetical protein